MTDTAHTSMRVIFSTIVLALAATGPALAQTAAAPLLAAPASWLTTGDAGTSPATNFLGTTDAEPLIVKTDKIERLRILSTGVSALEPRHRRRRST